MSAAIQALITGTLTKDAEAKVSGSGKEYVALVVRTPGEQAQFVRAALWGDDCEGAMSLGKGDAVSIVGALTIGIWETAGKAAPSLSMMAHHCISPSIKKARKPAQRRPPPKPTQQQYKAACEGQATRNIQARDSLEDDLPWGAE